MTREKTSTDHATHDSGKRNAEVRGSEDHALHRAGQKPEKDGKRKPRSVADIPGNDAGDA